MKKILLFLLLLTTFKAYAQTLQLNDSSVTEAAPYRSGYNFGCLNFYENCQLMKNLLVYNDPGFEAGTVRQIMDLKAAGTATTFTDVNQFSTFPANQQAGATFTVVESVNGGAENGCTGTIASHTGPNRSYVTAYSWDGSSHVTFTGANSWIPGTSTVTIPSLQNGSFLTNKQGTVTTASSTSFIITLSSPPTNAASSGSTFGFVQTNASFSAPVYTINSVTNQGSSGCAAAFRAGDQIILAKTTFPTPEYWWEGGFGGVFNSAVAGGAQMLSDTTDLCANCGAQALDMHFPTGGGTVQFLQFYDTNPNEDIFVIMNGTFAVDFDAKSALGSPVLTTHALRGGSSGFDCGTKTHTLTSSWQHFHYTCTATETPSTVGPTDSNAGVQVNGSSPSGAGDIYIDNLSMEKTSPLNSANTTQIRDEVMQGFYDQFQGPCSPAVVGTMRYWINQNAESIDNWTRPIYQRNPTGTGYGIQPGGQNGYQLGLEEYLESVENAQTVTGCTVEPYLEMPITMLNTDAQNLVEFLAAPAAATSSVYGQRRVNLGHSTPWTTVFPTLWLTLCNECWNGSFVYQNIQGDSTGHGNVYTDYSIRTGHVLAAMRADPYYLSNIQLGMDFQTQNNFSADAAIATAKPDYVEIEDYSYGSVGSFATPAALWSPLYFEVYLQMVSNTDPHKFNTSWNDYSTKTTCGASGTVKCKIGIYEQGEGTISGTIASSQVDLDHVNAGGGYGIAAALQFLLHQQLAPNVFVPQNFFSWVEFRNGSTGSATTKLWGANVEFGGASSVTNTASYGGAYTPRPHLLAMLLANKSVIGPMYSCPISSNVTYNFAGSSTNGPAGVLPALSNVPYLFAFCFENGSNRSLVLINTDTASSHSMTFGGTNVPTGTVTTRRYAVAANPNALNEADTGTYTGNTVGGVVLTTSSGAAVSSVTLPPYSITALDYSAGGTAEPTFTPAAGTYTGTQSITIVNNSAAPVMCYNFTGAPATNGTTGCAPGSTLVTGAISVSSTSTLYAVAGGTGFPDSAVNSAAYTISAATVANPTFSPVAGTYLTAQSVAVSTITSGASICVGVNTMPTVVSNACGSGGTLYTGAITVNTSETLNAIAFKSGATTSGITSAAYVITIIPTPTNLNGVVALGGTGSIQN